MLKLIIILMTLFCSGNTRGETVKDDANLTSKHFQPAFFSTISKQFDLSARRHLDSLLSEFKANENYAKYAKEMNEALQNEVKLEHKILLIKQLLDVEDEQRHHLKHVYTLRNVNYLQHTQQRFVEMEEECNQEERYLRMYKLCAQFLNRETKSNNLRLSDRIKLAPLKSPADASSNKTIIAVNINDFGKQLYARVKAAGANVIDDYLSTLRKLLQEVIDERPESAQKVTEVTTKASYTNTSADSRPIRLNKLLVEIDAILNTIDFYEKRQRLYAYLQDNLAKDYEQFKNSEYAEEDLAEIFAKLREKGLDLFVSFLFHNFEFLEHLHDELNSLLTVPSANEHYDETTQQLSNIHTLYQDFKLDFENIEKYEAYLQQVKDLYAKTQNESEKSSHIYELLHNASQNVGSVTLNMIKAKCDEI